MRQYAALYARVDGEPFPIPAVRLSDIDPEFLRKVVAYPTNEQPGTIVVDATNHFLYLVQGGGRAVRYGVGVGRQGFGWSGVATIQDKQEWPDWYPPKEMIARQPELRRQVSELQGGLGVPGGPAQSAGLARAVPLAGQQGHPLPHPRHGRTVDHRHQRVLRLHPHDQPGCHRPLPAHAGRREGRGTLGARGRVPVRQLSGLYISDEILAAAASSRVGSAHHETDHVFEQFAERRAYDVGEIERCLFEHTFCMAQSLEAFVSVVGAHAARSDATKRNVVLGVMEIGFVDRDAAGRRTLEDHPPSAGHQGRKSRAPADAAAN